MGNMVRCVVRFCSSITYMHKQDVTVVYFYRCLFYFSTFHVIVFIKKSFIYMKFLILLWVTKYFAPWRLGLVDQCSYPSYYSTMAHRPLPYLLVSCLCFSSPTCIRVYKTHSWEFCP